MVDLLLPSDTSQARFKRSDRGKIVQARYYRSDAKRAASIRWMNGNRDKHRVHKLVFRLIRRGLLSRKPCEICGAEKSEAHHDDYSEPLKIVWLCHFHHHRIKHPKEAG